MEAVEHLSNEIEFLSLADKDSFLNAEYRNVN